MHDDPNSLSNPQLKDKHELAANVGKGITEVYKQCCLHNTKAFSAVYWVPREVKVKVKFTLEQTTKDQRESRGIDLLFL